MEYPDSAVFVTKAAIIEVIMGYFAALDQQRFDVATMRLETVSQSFVRFRATQHMPSSIMVRSPMRRT